MPITRTNMVDDDGSGLTGTIINNAWKHELYGQIDALIAGNVAAWVNVPFAATDFTGTGSMVWTVPGGAVVTYAYGVVGRTVFVALNLVGTTITGAAGQPLNVKLPAGFVPVRSSDSVAWGLDNGTGTIARVRLVGGDAILRLYRSDFANWSLANANMSISMQFFYQF